MAMWEYFVYCMMPIAFFTLIVLNIPFPIWIDKKINRGIRYVGNLTIPYTDVTIIHFLVIISVALMIITYLTALKYNNKDETNKNNLLGINIMANRWRAEWNMWIAITNMVMYWAIYLINYLKQSIYQYSTDLDQKNHKEEETLSNIDNDQLNRETYDDDGSSNETFTQRLRNIMNFTSTTHIKNK